MRRAVRAAPRRGFVLLLVLVVVPMLALAGYAFTHLMGAEARASRAAQRQAQARALADAGIQYALSVLTDKSKLVPGNYNFHDNAAAFANVAVPGGSRDGFFSLIAPSTSSDGAVRYGLVNECSKLPLKNALLAANPMMFAGLPNMTPEISDKLADWLDADDSPRSQGAESSYYAGLPQPLVARNGDPLTLDELLGVPGVTPALFLGEDADRDGFLGPHENDQDLRWPPDNGDGTLDRGWRPFLTVSSKAGNLDPDGNQKTNLGGDANAAAAALLAKFSPEVAGFYALHKSKNQSLAAVSSLADAMVQVTSTEAVATLNGVVDSNKKPLLDTAAVMKTLGIPQPQPQQPGRGGPGGGGQETPVPVASPWKSADAANFLPTALLYFSASEKATLPGLIDPAWASAAVLQGLPGLPTAASSNANSSGSGAPQATGIDAETAAKIVNAAQNHAGDPTPAWLVTDGILTIPAFQKIEPLLTSQGQVFTVQSVGFLDDGGPIARVEAVIDASGKIPKVVSRIDLTNVPCGISWQQLRQGSTTLGAQ